MKAEELGIPLEKTAPEVREILETLKRLEKEGYEFEAAEASFELLIRKVLNHHRRFFELMEIHSTFREHFGETYQTCEATVKLRVGDQREHTVAEGNGPVSALDQALRRALMPFYPELDRVQLQDYKVRIIDSHTGTSAKTRVLIVSSDGHASWDTVGVSENIIEASWKALVDSYEFSSRVIRTILAWPRWRFRRIPSWSEPRLPGLPRHSADQSILVGKMW